MGVGRTSRLVYVDVFRGFALLYMVVCHLFTYFSDRSVYTSRPYFIPGLNIPTLLPPPYLFLVVAGMSVWLMLEKRRREGFAGASLALKGVRRYGVYVLVSLPFTLLMFGFDTYYTWAEAIQGIGLAAAVIACIYSFRKYRSGTVLAGAVLIYFSKPLLEKLIVGFNAPFYPSGGILPFILGFFFNLGLRGWFSLASAVPMLLVGVALIQWFTSGNAKKVVLAGLLGLVVSLSLHFLGFPIDYYNRTPATILFIIGESALACSIMYYLVEKRGLGDFLKPVSLYGFYSIWVYLGHFLLIAKPLEIAGMADSLSESWGWIFSIIATTISFVACGIHAKKRGRWIIRNRSVGVFAGVLIITAAGIYGSGYVLNGFSSGKNILVVAAHPDDETFGAGGVVIRQTHAGNHVRILMLTDGAPDEIELSGGYRRQRLMELEKALGEIGLSKSHVIFWNLDDLNFVFDGGLEGISSLVDRFSLLAETMRPDEVYVHAYEHGHIDHDAANYIVARGLSKSGVKAQLYEYSSYNKAGYGVPLPPEMTVFDDREYPLLPVELDEWQEEIKKRMGSWYVSQDQYGVCGLSLDWPHPRQACRESILRKFYHRDWIRRYPGYDYRRSPCVNDGCRYSQQEGGVEWSRWYQLIREYEEKYDL